MRDDETKELRRGIRLDLVIAVCALLVSAAATGASWWQSRVIADQLSAQVWPYLSIQTTYNPDGVALDVLNDGLGPAIVRSAVLTIDGKPVSNPADAVRLIFTNRKGRRMGSQLSDIGPGVVIRASATQRVFRLIAPWAVPQFAAASKRVDFSVCYCSLLGNCWQVAMSQTGDPVPVRTCPAVGAAQYKVPALISP